jgi:hypothetical protein
MNDIKCGDVWRSIWGCEQTNVDFYEVTRVTKTMVTLVQLDRFTCYDHATMTGTTKPIPGARIGEPIRRKVKHDYDGTPYVDLASYSMAPTIRPYHGEVLHYSDYA